MRRLLLTVLTILFVFYVSLLACTDIMVGKLATTDGSVISSQTVNGTYDSRIIIVPAADHEPGEMAPVYEWIVYGDRMPLVKLGEIPQVQHTYQYFNNAYPFGNEHQLLIGETTQGGAKETANSEYAIMTIEQLEVFALQRCKTAREAVQLMGDLAVEYGYRESCRLGEGLSVSDPNEVWFFEVYGVGPLWRPGDGPGAVWAAQRVPDDHVSINGNYSMIGEIDLETNRPPNVPESDFLICDNYLETAVEIGRFDLNSGEPFVWKYVYGDIKGKWSSRTARFFTLLNPSGNWDYNKTDDYPFSFKPDKKLSVYDVIELFRDVAAGTPNDVEEAEAWYYTDSKGNVVKSNLASPQPGNDIKALLGLTTVSNFASHSTSCFYINQSRSWLPDPIGGVVWFGLSNSQKTVVVPLYCANTEVPVSWTIVNRSDKTVDRNAAYYAFATVNKISNQRYQVFMPQVVEVRDPIQQRLYRMQEPIEKVALELYNQDPARAIEFLTNYTSSVMLEVEKAYWKLADTLVLQLQ